MESLLAPLLPLYARERAAGRSLVLGIVTATVGSTYRKPGALLLVAADGEYAGLVSGGCLEADLREHARVVLSGGAPRTVRYDLRDPNELLWGLGLGCEGAIEMLLLRLSSENHWQPLAHFAECLMGHRHTAVAIIMDHLSSLGPFGTVLMPAADSSPDLQHALAAAARCGQAAWLEAVGGGSSLFMLPLALPPRVLLLGAGPDAVPVVDFAARLGWKVTLVDHRPSYAQPMRYPQAERVLLARPEELRGALDFSQYAAAVVMSHHLPSDLGYLQALADSAIAYVGVLGPAVRRERLLEELGVQREALQGRLRAPVGLALGGRGPESIALSIVAEIHAFLHGAPGGSFSDCRG